MNTYTLQSEEDNTALCESLDIELGSLILLYGEMGAGKTTFTRYLCQSLGNSDWVNSPTYTIINCYTGPPKICHVDLYRLNSEDEILHLDLQRYIDDPEFTTIIEWPEKYLALASLPHIKIQIEKTEMTEEAFS